MDSRESVDAIERSRPGRRAMAAILVGALVLFVLGVVTGRTLSPDEAPPRSADSASPDADDKNQPIALGYSRSEQGAVAAATHFARVMAGASDDADAYEAAMLALAAPEWEAEAKKLARNTSAFVKDRYGEGATVTFSPVRYRLASYADETAVVELWGVTLASGPKIEGIEESWITGTIHLVWSDQDWRVSSQESASGPTPELLRADDEVIPATVLEDFEEYDRAPQP